MSGKRVVSLLSSATEIVCALDRADLLVGISHECDFPESITHLPVCSRPKFAVDGSSCEIDQRIKTIVRDGLSVYEVLTDLLEELQPDVVITQTQCEVCAVSLQDLEQAVCETITSKPEVIALETNCLADLWIDMQRVANALGVPDRGRELTASLQRSMDSIERETKLMNERPSVACIEWIEPMMAAGNWMPELVAMAGGENMLGEAGKHSPWLTWEELINADPDIILVLPCGWDIKRAREEMVHITKYAEWEELDAVKSGEVYLMDGSQYFNRPGPRLLDSLEILAEIFCPDIFRPRHEHTGWERL